MAKTSAWLFTLIGVLFVLPLLGMDTGTWGPWLVALAFLVVGITKLVRNYSAE
ncbi:MAG: hypothetical protein NUV97_02010 [archaeon]|nr:hypothetical protein [archaeon]MCR4323726.1 hypothetical protein [Nanoarchaeota archaeon]